MLKRVALSIVLLACAATTATGALAGRDSDHDGLSDHTEVHRYHTDPHRRDTDRDGLSDRAEVRRYHTNPRKKDTDRDGLSDRAEIRRYHTNPRKKDTDRDGLSDRAEIRRYHTNPRKKDTDRDGFGDGAEVRAGTNPRNPRSHPPGSALSPAAGGSPGGSSPPGGGSPIPTPNPGPFPDASNTGVPAGTGLHSCSTTIGASGTYDACQFNGDVLVKASNVTITRSLIKGSVDAGSGRPGEQSGLVIRDSEIDCGCPSLGASDTPTAIMESNYTLTRVEIHNSGHGAAVKDNVVIEDSWIHGLGGNTDAHKDGIFSGDGTNVTIRHNNIECNDGSHAGCTSAIGLLTDFGDITYYTIDNNLLNTVGSYCFYGSGGPQKQYSSNHITFTNNHFGRSISSKCGHYGPVTYFDSKAAGMVWSGNVWDDTGARVPAEY